MSISEHDSWELYSKLVLKELETLTSGIRTLNIEIQDLKKEMALLKEREDKVEEIKIWKDKIVDIVTPSQLSLAMQEIKELKEYKTKSTTVFLVMQGIFAATIAILEIYSK